MALNARRELEVAIRNEGDATLGISELTSSDAQFTVLTSVPLQVSAHTSQPVRIRFRPTSAGLQQAALAITSNDPDEGHVDVVLRGTGTRGRQPATVRFYCLSLRVPPATAELGGETYTAEFTGGFEEDPVNHELAPMFYPDDPLFGPDLEDFSHASELRISTAGIPEPLLRGTLFANVPEPNDANGNEYPDFFEVSEAVTTTTDGLFMSFEEIPVELAWERAAGSRQGTVQVRMGLAGFGNLAFDAGFELIEYVGTLDYTPGENQVTRTVQLTRTGEAGRTLAGPVVLTKDPGWDNLLNLNEGTWVAEGGGEWRYFESPIQRRTSANYFRIIEALDGDLNTSLEDCFLWVMSIDDPNDADGDGTSDLLDEPGGPAPTTPPTVSIALSGTTLSISISGDIGKPFVLEESAALTAPTWSESLSGTLTEDPTVLNLPLPGEGAKFYRVRMLE